MIKFISSYQAEIAGVAFFALLIFALLLFNGVIGARPKTNKDTNDKRKQFGSNLDAYKRIDSDLDD